MMKNVTLISDWKLRDTYVSILKGVLISHIPDVQIFDISHAIEKYNIGQAAFIAKASFSHFPENTVHIINVGGKSSNNSNPILLSHKNHWFLGEDTGVFQTIIGDEEADAIYQFNGSEEVNWFQKMALMIQALFENKLENCTVPISKLNQILDDQFYYIKKEKSILGKIIYIDSFFNAVTNIPNEVFLEAVQGKEFTVTFSDSKKLDVTKMHSYYNANEKEIYLFPNKLGYIEITFYKGAIAMLGDLKINDTIEIQFT